MHIGIRRDEPHHSAIQPGDQAAVVTLSVASTVDVSAVVVGDQVHVEGLVVTGVLTLTSIDVQQGDSQGPGNQATSEVTATVTALSATSVSVSWTRAFKTIGGGAASWPAGIDRVSPARRTIAATATRLGCG